MASLRGAFVAVVQAADLWNGPGEGVAKLLYGPGGRGLLRDSDTHDAPAIMREQH